MLESTPPDSNTPTTSTWRCWILSRVASAWALVMPTIEIKAPSITGNNLLTGERSSNMFFPSWNGRRTPT
ncbi:hypothetical protein PS843_05963 [Pseudomonas fluorescens]|nr:hypothetical protein PS843_05963 [Pseudomonas fluorescens]